MTASPALRSQLPPRLLPILYFGVAHVAFALAMKTAGVDIRKLKKTVAQAETDASDSNSFTSFSCSAKNFFNRRSPCSCATNCRSSRFIFLRA